MVGHPTPHSSGEEPTFQAYRAPRGHRDHLIEPSLSEASRLIRANRDQVQSYPSEIRSLRLPARQQLIRDARKYTLAYRDDAPSIADSPDGLSTLGESDVAVPPIVMAGHQPTLFHPGVWFKNFALARIGSSTPALAVNLVVDSDVAGPSSIRVPHKHSGGLGFAAVSYDRRGGGVPYEQALIEDREQFDAFDENVRDALGGLVADPLITPLWKHARDAINRCGFAGCALAQARHRLEADLGLQTLEIPQSVVCRGEAFARFVMLILSDLPRFHQCYNDSAEIYRRAHGIRSHAHPVPNLGRDGEWFEAPLWVYGNQSPKRRAVWVRRNADGTGIEISDRTQRSRTIGAVDSDSAYEAFLALSSPEFKIRSRALLTTMFARLVLSDLFLHGIGGGKYDQLGDLISRSYWNLEPPKMMVLSSTVLLPGHESHPMHKIDRAIRSIQRDLRDLNYQPERFAESSTLPADMLVAKRAMLDSIPPPGQRHPWHEQITDLNRRMAAELEPLRQDFLDRRAALQEQRRETTIWNNREHPFCVYPLDFLTDAYTEMLV